LIFAQLNIRGRLILGFSVLCNPAGRRGGYDGHQGSDRQRINRTDGQPSGSDRHDGKRPGFGDLCVARIAARLSDHRQRRVQVRARDARGKTSRRMAPTWIASLAIGRSSRTRRIGSKLNRCLTNCATRKTRPRRSLTPSTSSLPAKILATEAAPLAKLMLQKATSIINEEGNIASTDTRKSLLIDFADMRGSMAMAIGAIRAYLLTATRPSKSSSLNSGRSIRKSSTRCRNGNRR